MQAAAGCGRRAPQSEEGKARWTSYRQDVRPYDSARAMYSQRHLICLNIESASRQRIDQLGVPFQMRAHCSRPMSVIVAPQVAGHVMYLECEQVVPVGNIGVADAPLKDKQLNLVGPAI